MKTDYSHIVIVLDRSGSMGDCKAVTIEGFNSFLQKQKELKGKGTITFVQFDDRYELNYDFLPLENAPLLTNETYKPRGLTALLDAIGRTIDSTGKQLAALSESERPSRVIFVIQTDGEENDSKEYITPMKPNEPWNKGSRVRDMIKHQQEAYNWDFVFLGAGQDAIATATSYGINSKSALTYGVAHSRAAFDSAAAYTSSFRSAVTLSDAKLVSFSDDDRNSAVVGDTTSQSSTSTSQKTRGKGKVTA